jgi:hypothetical protein
MEPQAGGDPEVAAAAADRPEELGMGVGVGADRPAVGGHQLGRQQAVDGQAVLAGQVPDAAAQGEAPDAHRRGVAEADGQPVPGRLGGHLPGGQAGLRPGGPPGGVDLQRLELGQVEHDPPSQTLWPALLCPPPRTASSSPRSAASETTWATSAVSVGQTMARGRRSNPP